MELFDLTGKTAVITGGGRGLGKGVAVALAQAGADVVIVGNIKEELEESYLEISDISKNNSYNVIDVRDTESIRGFIRDTIKKRGSIDILVNAAGVQVRKPFLEITEDDYDIVMDVNLKSIFFTCQEIIPYMMKQKKGKIINFASLTSAIGLRNTSPYGASKGGVAQLTKAMAVEFAEYGIQINAIGPGYYKSKITESLFQDIDHLNGLLSRIPMRRTGEPQDLAGTAIFLASSASDYITGQTIYVDGGWLSS
jgi:NAD(P)-dependent dehydrogenase (short-subunit alcohol dehydrogenase family)